jgi:parvulin-like peptidyl-prolyl isomerase
MKQFLLIASVSASLLSAQGTTPSPAQPKTLPHPPSPQEVLAGRPGGPAAPAVAPDAVVLTVGEEKITAKEFDSYIEGLPEQLRAQARGPLKRQMADQIVRVKLLSQQARKEGLDQDPATKARIAFQVENLLAGAAYNDLLKKAKVDDAAARKYYDEHKNEYDEVSARHILIKFKGSPVPAREGKPELSEEQALAKAQEIRKKLTAGEDFATLAKAESDDAGSGANGGELGTFKRNSMVPEFEKTAFSLPVGQVSEPIKTQFGYHIIKVDKHDSPAFEGLREQIDEKMKPEQARQTVELMAKNANVVMNEAYFGPAQPAMMPAGPGAPPQPQQAPAATETPKPAATDAHTAPRPPASKPAVKTKPATPKTAPAK